MDVGFSIYRKGTEKLYNKRLASGTVSGGNERFPFLLPTFAQTSIYFANFIKLRITQIYSKSNEN